MKKFFDRSWATLHSWNKNREAVIYDKYVGRNVENPAFVKDGNTAGIATRYELDGPGSNPDSSEIFRIRPDRPWGLSSLLYNGYRVFPGRKAAGAWR